MDLESILYYSILDDILEKEERAPPLKLYSWYWSGHQNYDKQSGVQRLLDELRDYPPEKLVKLVRIWEELEKVSFRYVIFHKNEIIIGEPSSNVKDVGKDTDINITYHINGRYCGHQLLYDKFRDPNYKSQF